MLEILGLHLQMILIQLQVGLEILELEMVYGELIQEEQFHLVRVQVEHIVEMTICSLNQVQVDWIQLQQLLQRLI